ncbi:signal peptidase I [Bombilactobacillus folatiphilus]|uniref:Signal peptidase I n=1 Tax=Bombilactobacillus folatiphilus TaxID=2923362 RepID=A0ABY4P9V1_9LACO|nr:signal peptidase I [Bombilactobacillus folatiphilus]UQS82390.1 signal peptidase I [Bombilactobacillus folatiphilus]
MQIWSNLKHFFQKNHFGFTLFLGVIVVVALFTYLLFNVVWINGTVHGRSMQPNFYAHDRVLVSPNAPIHRGDIVLLDPPGSSGNKLFVKRVIAGPHDQIRSNDDTTYINNHPISEPYLDPYKTKLPPNQLLTKNFTLKKLFGLKKVPAQSYFVMGDNRRQSADSRYFGPVKKSRIIGVVKVRYWPLNRITFY